jgi:Spy/CpxP family protein refolding chaperone
MTFPHDPAPRDPASETPARRAPLRGWVKGVLFVSLALNLAVAGLAIGAVLRHGDMNNSPRARVDQIGGPYTAALSREDRRSIWRDMRAMQGEGRSSRGQIRAEFDAVVDALRADPYDPAQVRAIVERQFQAGIERQQLGQSLLLARIDTMTPAERLQFADRLAERLEKRRDDRARDRPVTAD